jgi:succinate dehydrogenase (ubiquinone) cytochrome b560 subunit
VALPDPSFLIVVVEFDIAVTTMLPSRLINRHLLNGIPSSPLYRRKLIGLVVRPSLVRTTPTILNHYRPLTTESIPANEAGSIIASQRKNRPTSPHLSIYKPQITWYLSMTHRITGAILSGGISPPPPSRYWVNRVCFV